MLFQRDHFYTHRNFFDVNIRVKSANQYASPDYGIVLYVAWHLKTGMPMGQYELIHIKPEQLKNWSEVPNG